MPSRRRFLQTASLGVTAAAVSPAALSAWDRSEVPNPEPLWTAKDYRRLKPAVFQWPSERAVEEHMRLYRGYVNKANELWEKIAQLDRDPAKANATYSDIRVMKVELTFAIGGVKNHEIYFDILGGSGGAPRGRLAEAIQKNFGSFEAWAADLKATGIAARGWVWLAYDFEKKTLFNYIGDSQNLFPIWNASPILALDMFEHAFFMDYGTNRGAYIDDFLKRIDWAVVEANFERVLRMTGL
ncbi:MAG: Fe-Mn family superoxide dismutase [Bacteroidetes bacterium]|nr:Fe-Mn family superoxide dismutase [Rhodothermia bacterium]MCS7155891.1 Fe-Mn family superoxide dismutase [Bacteroidota bacterium]MCX7906008.1 Fe-Mn family superoxide dismutase [Bacteroidota bacterium]MDW8138136.1 Fe-Mn family superoxide dismutase [Bacteroidota bacterium]MDW8285820.1 Fe-Mn family superoxide dismutase [Bacteroidota bacterium]